MLYCKMHLSNFCNHANLKFLFTFFFICTDSQELRYNNFFNSVKDLKTANTKTGQIIGLSLVNYNNKLTVCKITYSFLFNATTHTFCV